jgi:hypothetical protein
MREFFHGWRRKLGCVTLVMALVLMVGWMRTRVVQDGVSLRISEQLFYSIASRDGTLHLVRASYTEPITGAPFIKWYTMPRPDDGKHITQMPTMRWRWQAAKFGVGDLARPEVVFTFWITPFWFPTGLLTIVSAWLLLSKPRPRPTTPSPDHA